ncbi:MAG: hypothetical protein ACI4HN_07995 [Ruminococcus sp.]
MSRKNKLITALLSIVLCFSIFTITAYAVDSDGDGIDDDVVVTEPPAIVETDPPYVEPETEAPYYEPETEAPYYEPETEAPYYEPEEPNYNSDSSQIYYDSDNGGESSEFYVGGGQSYVPPASTAPSAPLYESNRKIDDSVLSNSDWKDISASLKNAGQGSENDSDDFGFIKNNDSLGDNGEWMLYTGIACLALSAAGIAYVIISSVSKHKKLSGGLSGKQYAYAGAGNGRYRSSSDYNDGYKDEIAEKKKIDKSRKYDTADVKLPKSSNGTRYKNGGKRYK